jgi:hypothetical protein
VAAAQVLADRVEAGALGLEPALQRWVAARAARVIERRSRRANMPGLHLPLVWFPRAANALVNLMAFRPRGMKALIVELAPQ